MSFRGIACLLIAVLWVFVLAPTAALAADGDLPITMPWEAERPAPRVVPLPDRRPRPPRRVTVPLSKPVETDRRAPQTRPVTAPPAATVADPVRKRPAPTTATESEEALDETGALPPDRMPAAPVPRPAAHLKKAIARPSAAPGSIRVPLPRRRPSPRTAVRTDPGRDAARRREPVRAGERTPPARERPARSSDAKCAVLGKCRDAFARCKAAFIKKEGRWDLDKEPCGDKYAQCIREHFEPGEMWLTRWFWPYESCR